MSVTLNGSRTPPPRIPPHDLAAERALIGALLLPDNDQGVAFAAEICSAADFYAPAHGHIYDAQLALYNEGETIDVITVADQLRRSGLLEAAGGSAALIDLQSTTPSRRGVRRWARIIHGTADRRRIISGAYELGEATYAGESTAHLDLLAEIVDRLRAVQTGPENVWAPVDLMPAWRGEKVRPVAAVFQRDDGVALLPPGLNYLFGDSGDGKTMVAQLATTAEIKAGFHVVWISYEDANEDLFVDRLQLFGVTEAEAMLVKFIVPQTGLVDGARQIADLAASVGARLVVLDSVGEAMAVGGVDEDRDAQVGPWFRQTLRLIHNLDPALTILPIDHSTKSKDNPLFPSGSKRKRAAPTGRMYLLNVRQPFAIGQVGYVQLVVAKDRGGTFKRGAIAAEITLDATTTPYTFTVTAPREGDTYAPKVSRRNAADRVLEVLGEAHVALTAEQIARIANGPDRKLPAEAMLTGKTVKNALTELSKVCRIAQAGTEPSDGRRPLTLWKVVDEPGDAT